MEKKPNITPTPLVEVYINKEGFKDVFIKPATNYAGICKFYDNNITVKTHDEAVEWANKFKTAVNCTYGNNINPEKIGELVQKLEDILIQYNGVGIVNEKWVQESISEALNNIKYKD